jgi:diacylglycerol kinase (ATP)
MIKKRIAAFGYACEGIIAAFKKELHLKIHLLATVLVVCAGFYFDVTQTEWMILILCCISVISLELINSAIETLTDAQFKAQHPKAKYIKDVAAGAVLVAAIGSAVIGGVVFFKYL